MPVTGLNPEFCTYICNDCGEKVILSKDIIIFPPYPNCYGTSFRKA